jgi:hypothetical protein
MKWFLRACPVCGGDLHEDLEDEHYVTCFLCSRSFPREQIAAEPAATGRRRSPLRPAA